jgi:hypothetical protein
MINPMQDNKKACVLGKMNKNVMANVIGDYWLPEKH